MGAYYEGELSSCFSDQGVHEAVQDDAQKLKLLVCFLHADNIHFRITPHSIYSYNPAAISTHYSLPLQGINV